MKKIAVLLLILAAVLLVYFYSMARQGVSLKVHPQATTGAPASSMMPEEVESRSQVKQSSKGSQDLKVTGPVWVEE